MSSWYPLWTQIQDAVTRSQSRSEAAKRVSGIRGTPTTWNALSRAWRRYGNGNILESLGTTNVSTSEGKRLVWIPDGQNEWGKPMDHWLWVGRYIRALAPDRIQIGGDWSEMASLSVYDSAQAKAVSGITLQRDIDAHNKAAELLHEGMRDYKPPDGIHYCEGNHDGFGEGGRPQRYLRDNPHSDLLRPELFADSWLGWVRVPFLKVDRYHGIAMSHFFGAKSARSGCRTAQAQMKYVQGSCIAGHYVGLDMVPHMPPDTELCRWSIIAGSCYQHNKGFLGQNSYWRGIIVANDIHGEGEFDPMPISLRYLKRKFG